MSSMRRRTELRREIERTAGRKRALAVRFTPDSRYVQIQDEAASWWQPVEALLPILRELPDLRPGEDHDASWRSWCRTTAKAGLFGGRSVRDTMPVANDFNSDDDHDDGQRDA